MENIVNKQVVELRCYYWSAPFLWIAYLSFVSKKISKSGGGGGFIAKARFYLSSKTLLTLYYSPEYPNLTHCNIAWSFTYRSNQNCIYFSKAQSAAHSKSSLARKYLSIIKPTLSPWHK